MGQMGSSRRDPAQIRAGIESARAEIADSLLAMRDEVGERLDWRNQIRRRPLAAIGLAFAVGFLLAGRGRRDCRCPNNQ